MTIVSHLHQNAVNIIISVELLHQAQEGGLAGVGRQVVDGALDAWNKTHHCKYFVT